MLFHFFSRVSSLCFGFFVVARAIFSPRFCCLRSFCFPLYLSRLSNNASALAHYVIPFNSFMCSRSSEPSIGRCGPKAGDGFVCVYGSRFLRKKSCDRDGLSIRMRSSQRNKKRPRRWSHRDVASEIKTLCSIYSGRAIWFMLPSGVNWIYISSERHAIHHALISEIVETLPPHLCATRQLPAMQRR